MTQTHSPGPWRVRTGLPRAEGPAVFAAFHMAEGPDMLVQVAECDSPSIKSEEREANARLIAAAPELLAALEAAWSAIVEVEDWNEQIEDDASRVPLDTREKLRQAAYQAIAAITKASPQAP